MRLVKPPFKNYLRLVRRAQQREEVGVIAQYSTPEP
jgi:hypothetical protein